MIKPVYTGVPQIMSAVNTFSKDAPYVSLWSSSGKILLAQFRDKADMPEQLEDILDNAVDVNNTDVFIIKFHPKLTDGWITDKTPVVTSLPVQPLTRNASVSGSDRQWLPASQYAAQQSNAVIGKIEELFKPLNDRLTALEEAGAPAEEIDPVDKWLERLKHPAIGSLITALASKFAPGLAMQAVAPNMQISGVPGELPEWNEGLTDEQIEGVNQSLDELKAAGMDMTNDLAKLSAMSKENSTLFNMLLGQLRSQK